MSNLKMPYLRCQWNKEKRPFVRLYSNGKNKCTNERRGKGKFTAGRGWLDKFKTRQGIRELKLSDESCKAIPVTIYGHIQGEKLDCKSNF